MFQERNMTFTWARIGLGRWSIHWFRCKNSYRESLEILFLCSSVRPFSVSSHFIMTFYCSFNSKSFQTAYSLQSGCQVATLCKKFENIIFNDKHKKLLLLLLLLGRSFFVRTYLYTASLVFVKLYGFSISFYSLSLTEHQFRMQQNHCNDRTISLFLHTLGDCTVFLACAFFYSAVGVYEKSYRNILWQQQLSSVSGPCII